MSPWRHDEIYQPLQSGWIRLAVLHPGSPGDSITVTLKPAQLSPQPSQYYEALSYVWGMVTETEKVIVNGFRISVTPNLLLALQRLRFTDRARTLWVDAVCINQDDVAEKSHQVEQMATVYKLADKVLIHLGPLKNSKDENAMDIIAAVDQPLTAEIACQVSDSIFKSPWFDRVWVVQEAALAKVAIVILGDKAVRWDCFTAWPMRVAPYRIDRIVPGILALPPRFQPVEGSLLQRLHETRPLKATDRRDKVFGLLGLIPDREPWIRLVDYGVRAETIFTSVAKCFVDHERSLRFLSAVHPIVGSSASRHTYSPLDQLRSPSWVPDWSVNPEITPIGIGRDSQEPYNAGGYPAVARATEDRLIAKGVLLDTVGWMGSSYGTVASDSGTRPHLRAHLCQPWLRLLSTVDEPGSRESDELRKVADWAMFFKAPTDSEPSTCCTDASVSFRAVTTAAPPTTLQREEIGCRRWKSKTGITALAELGKPLDRVCFGRRIFETESGLVGLGPDGMQPGDRIVVLLGGPTPYVIRRIKEDDRTHSFIGECYVLGAMGGEGLKHLHDELRVLGHYLGPCGAPICNAKLQDF
ncbi:heterokaryon incompatibility protein-domain-containing protein, partial [Podospora aff. communis PSN243]